MDGGIEQVTDPEEDRLARKQARRVMMRSLALAAAITAAICVWP